MSAEISEYQCECGRKHRIEVASSITVQQIGDDSAQAQTPPTTNSQSVPCSDADHTRSGRTRRFKCKKCGHLFRNGD